MVLLYASYAWGEMVGGSENIEINMILEDEFQVFFLLSAFFECVLPVF